MPLISVNLGIESILWENTPCGLRSFGHTAIHPCASDTPVGKLLLAESQALSSSLTELRGLEGTHLFFPGAPVLTF